jgi:hypothetical protein
VSMPDTPERLDEDSILVYDNCAINIKDSGCRPLTLIRKVVDDESAYTHNSHQQIYFNEVGSNNFK